MYLTTYCIFRSFLFNRSFKLRWQIFPTCNCVAIKYSIALWCLYKCTLEAFKIIKILILALKRGRVEIGIDENYESNIDFCNVENSKIQDQSYNLVPNQTRIGTNTENLEKSLNDQDSLCCEKDPFPSEAGSM
ncbi:unnamed protein product [Blepharisma stoltei]|uniref:Uncharacterized protein n=1 Tax=Blepharisma stoltei TaxID=1481888 RepID=A0AAU9J7A9_9CILI|nr:unnamed protein product [Blepharisma stoltei]